MIGLRERWKNNGRKRRQRCGKRFFAVILCIVISAVLFAAGRCWYQKGNDFLQTLTIWAEGDGFDFQALESLEAEMEPGTDRGDEATGTALDETEDKVVSFAAWTELKNQGLSDDRGGRGCRADVIAIYGSSHCLLPWGKNLTASDTAGCLIGEDVAEELFGGYQVEGQKLVWKDREWVVRGIVREPSKLCMVQASELAGAGELIFDRISIGSPGGEDRRVVGEKFMNRYGLLAHVLRWDYLYGMAWLGELVPGEWSDFEGWKKNFEEHGKAVERMEGAGKAAVEMTGLEYRKRGIWLMVAGMLLGAVGVVMGLKTLRH